MESYLLELIRENNRIIIPNFGAFIVSREKGQNILFNNFLSFNDGLLISHICAVEGVDSANASQKVDDFVAHINSTLDDKGLFEIEGIGQFTKDESGVLRFEQSPSDIFGTDDKHGSRDASTQEADALTPANDNDLLDLDTSDPEEAPMINPAAVENERFSQPDKPAAYSDESSATNISSVHVADDKSDDLHEESASDENVYIVKEEKKLAVGLIILIILILLLLISSTLWFFTDVFDGFKDKDMEPVQKTEQVAPPEKIEEAQVEEETGFVEEEIIEEPVVVSTRQHHVIVGSFRDEARALNQMQVLVNKGYSNASILPYEGRFLLSVEWYPSVNKALQRQEALLSELQMENWVLSLTVK